MNIYVRVILNCVVLVIVTINLKCTVFPHYVYGRTVKQNQKEPVFLNKQKFLIMKAIELLQKMEAEILVPLMVDAGFSNDGEIWWRSTKEFSLVLTLQKYWWSTDDKIDFRINLGLMIPPIQNSSRRRPEITEMAVCVSQDCYLPEDFQFHKFKNSIGYCIKNEDDANEFLGLIQRDFEDYIIPQLVRQETLEDCEEFYKDVPFWNQRLDRFIQEHRFKLMNNVAS